MHLLKTTPLPQCIFLKFRNGFNAIILDRMIFSMEALGWQIISSAVSVIGLFPDYGNWTSRNKKCPPFFFFFNMNLGVQNSFENV